MRRIAANPYSRSVPAVAAVAVFLCTAVAAVFAQQASSSVGTVKVTAKVIDITQAQWVLTGGRPHVRTTDGKIDVIADKIVVTLNPKARSSGDRVSAITATGSVVVDAVDPQEAGRVIHATADKAVYSYSAGTFVFDGHVHARITDPQFEEPTVIDAQTITVWVSERRVRVEGAPAQVDVTPKQKPARSPGKKE